MSQPANESSAMHERFVRFMEHLPGLAWIKDADGRYLYANEAALCAFGVNRQDLYGKTDTEVFPPETAQQFRRNDREALMHPEGVQVTETLRHPDGQPRVSLVRKFAIPDESGRPAFVGGMAVDITPRLDAERAARDSEERLRLATQSGKLGVWDWDIVKNRVTWTESLYEIHGVNREQFTGTVESFASLLHPEDRQVVSNAIKQSLEAGAPYELEFRAVRPDGKVIWLFTNAQVLHEDGRAVRMTGATFDITDRKRADAVLRDNEQLFRRMADAAPMLMWQSDANNRCTWLNQTWLDFTGRSLEQEICKGWTAGVHPEDLAQVLTQDEAAVARREPSELLYRLRRHDGEYRWVLDRSRPFFDASGAWIGYVGGAIDITDLRAAHKVQATLAAIVESSEDAIVAKNLQGIIQSWNAGAQRLYGYTPEEAIGQSIMLIIPAERRDEEDLILSRLRRGERIEHFETMRIAKDGRLLNISLTISPIRDASGRLIGVSKIARDITERKRSEESLQQTLEALRRSEAFAQSILQSSPDCVKVLDLEGRILWMNEAGCRLMDVDDFQHVRNNSWKEFWQPKELREAAEAAIAEAMKGGVGRFEGFCPTLKGVPKWWNIAVVGVPGSQGKPLSLLSVSRDVTEQRRIQDALRESDRRKDEFLATLAHELRNPLAPIRNALRIIREPEIPAEMHRTAHGMMERQLSQMVRLIDDLLDVARISTGKLELRRQDVTLAEVLRSAIESSQPIIDEMQHELVLEVPPDPIYLNADPTRLAQVVLNLLNNSAKYTEPGGRICLTVGSENDFAVITVRDSGIGIRPEMLPRLFELFVQSDRVAGHSRGGLGVGLSLVKRIVELHGGTVAAHSDGVGKGSEFTVRIPRTTQDDVRNDEPSATPAAIAPRRVLIVDDNLDAAESLQLLLQLDGHQTQIAHDGATAIASAERFKPQVILMDIGLPEMNGYDACRHIRQQSWANGIVVAALTGWGQDQDKRAAVEAGFDHHLVKPVDPDLLSRWLSSLPEPTAAAAEPCDRR